jgi:hypothetical protein
MAPTNTSQERSFYPSIDASISRLASAWVSDAPLDANLDRLLSTMRQMLPLRRTTLRVFGDRSAYTVIDIDRIHEFCGSDYLLPNVAVEWNADPAPAIDSSISQPVIIDDRSVARLEIAGGHETTESERHLTVVAAGYVGILLAESRAYVMTAKRVSNLERALTTRGTIERAKGLLMAFHRCDADHAFELMKQQSQHQNVKLADVAESICTRFEASVALTRGTADSPVSHS